MREGNSNPGWGLTAGLSKARRAPWAVPVLVGACTAALSVAVVHHISQRAVQADDLSGVEAAVRGEVFTAVAARPVATASAANAVTGTGSADPRPTPTYAPLDGGAGTRTGAGTGAEAGLTFSAIGGTGQVSWAPQPAGATTVELRDGAVSIDSCTTSGQSCSFRGLQDGTTYFAAVTHSRTGGGTTGPTVVATVAAPQTLASPATVFWLDAGEPTTLRGPDGLPAALGAEISTWQDRSPAHRDAHAAPGPPLPHVAQIGTHTAVRLDSGLRFEASARGLPTAGQASIVLAVALSPSTAAPPSTCPGLIAWGAPDAGRGRYVQNRCPDHPAFAGAGLNEVSAPAARAWPPDQATLIMSRFAARHVQVSLNQQPASDWVLPGTQRLATTNGAIVTVGATWAPGSGWVGDLGEVIVLSSAATTDMVEQVSAYLARKWNVGATPMGGRPAPGPASAQTPAAR